MPDSFILTSPDGATSVEIGTYTREANFGQDDLVKAKFIETPYSEGVLAIESAGVRSMVFPLILGASRSIPNLGLADQEALFRKLARPGAFIDLQPQGATAAVRFDVLAGRYEFDYSVHANREGIRLGRIELDVKPYGYWPTTILLASAASIGLPGVLTWTGSIIGDAPGLAKVAIQPTVPTSIPAGSWIADMLGYAIHGRASNIGHYRAGSLTALLPAAIATLIGDALAVSSQALDCFVSPTQAGWTQMAAFDIASALEPGHRGRYLSFGWFQLGGPSQGVPWYISLDAVSAANPAAALGSYARIATLAPAIGPGYPEAFGAQPSPAYTLLELGELTLPAVASGAGGGQRLRVWAGTPTTNVGVPSIALALAGLYLLPVEGDAVGILPQGLAIPSTRVPSAGRLTVDAIADQAIISRPDLNLATANPAANAWLYHRGALPRVTPSSAGGRIELIGGARRAWADGYRNLVGSHAAKAMFRFDELAGPTFIDYGGSWHGSYITAPSLGASGVAGYGARFDGASAAARIASVLIGSTATSWSIEVSAQRLIASIQHALLSQGANSGGNLLEIGYGPTQQIYFAFNGDDLAGGSIVAEARFANLWFTYDFATRTRAIWRNGELLASGVAVSTYKASGPIDIGRSIINGRYANARLDELNFHIGSAVGSSIVRARYQEWLGGATGPVVHSGQQFAAVSVSYRPRFQFLKGL